MGNRSVVTPREQARRHVEIAREIDMEIAQALKRQNAQQTKAARKHLASRSNFSYGRPWKRP
jgi:hypothetical protein